MFVAGILVWCLDSYIITLYTWNGVCFHMQLKATEWLVSDKSLLNRFSLVWSLCPGAIPYQFCCDIANIRMIIHHYITQAPNSVLTMVQKHRFL